jgi:type VI secretion system protein ImpG
VTDPTLHYFEHELEILRDLAADFGRLHPKIAGRLSIGLNETRDPHVERLVQAFAFLAARIHRRLDDDFPELTDALLGVLYPHYLQPVPSLAVVEFSFDPRQAATTGPHRLPRGTRVETETVDDEPCLYRTCSDVDLLPLRLAGTRLGGPPFRLPTPPPAGTAAVLEFELETLSDAVPIKELPLAKLRLHLHAGTGGTAFELYELLLTRCLGVMVTTGTPGEQPLLLGPEALQPAGFEPQQAALPTDPRMFPGYRLVSEFFALPQKFLFVDLLGIRPLAAAGASRRLRVSVLLDATNRDLERSVSADTVRLGCTPVVNLFPLRLDPLRLDGRTSDVCVVPDARRPLAVEVHSISGVRAIRPGGEAFAVRPFYGPARSAPADPGEVFWTASRRVRHARPDGRVDHGTDLWLSLVDRDGGRQGLANVVLDIEALCVNRDLPAALPFSPTRPKLALRDGQGPVGGVRCLSRPTKTLRPTTGQGAAWRLVSHLSLNHLSLVDDGDGPSGEALREILRLYLLAESDELAQRSRWIDGIRRVVGRRDTARVAGPLGGMCRGVRVDIELDEDSFADRAGYLFVSVLERFLGAWVAINSFTRLVAGTRQSAGSKEPWQWPPRAGDRVLV